MADKEYAKYDSDVDVEARNVRLAADAKSVSDTFVKLTFVMTSKGEKDEEMWWDAIPTDNQIEIAKHLKKGDVLTISGFPTMQRWGEGNEKVGHTLKRARLHIPLDLFMKIKERGFTPGGAKPQRGAPKQAARKASRPVIDLDDEE